MEVNTVFLSLVLIFLVYMIFKIQQQRSVNAHIPRAKGSTIFGAVVDYGKDPINFLQKTRKELGDVFIVDLFLIKFIFVFGGKNANKILTASEDIVSFWEVGLQRQPFLFPPKETFDVAVHITPLMKVLKSAMNSYQKLDEYGKIWVEIANRHFEQWSQQPKIDWFIATSNLGLESGFSFYMGVEFTKKEMIPLFDDYHRFEKLMASPLCLMLPQQIGPARQIRKIVNKFVTVIVREARRRLDNEELYYESNLGAFQYILNTLKEEGFYIFGQHVLSIVFAIIINSIPTFSWTVLHAYRSGKLSKFLSEISSHPPVNNIYPFNEMPYSEAALRETGRLYSNMIVPRILRESIVLQKSKKSNEDIVISPQSNTMVIHSAAVSARDNEIYENADEWIPERFLDLEKYKKLFQDNDFVQFGYGSHVCIGEKFAHYFLRGILWPTFFQNYELEILSPIVEGKGVSNLGIEPNWRENFGTPVALNKVEVRVTKKVQK